MNVKDFRRNSKIKCRFEDKDICHDKNCRYFHPKRTCQQYSKIGSCDFENRCEHRHPRRICDDWLRYRRCNRGDSCYYRHPFVMMRPKNDAYINPFSCFD